MIPGFAPTKTTNRDIGRGDEPPFPLNGLLFWGRIPFWQMQSSTFIMKKFQFLVSSSHDSPHFLPPFQIFFRLKKNSWECGVFSTTRGIFHLSSRRCQVEVKLSGIYWQRGDRHASVHRSPQWSGPRGTCYLTTVDGRNLAITTWDV